MNFFFYENDATANGYKTKKWSHWLVQPEIRYWTCETFNGWFLGLHAHGGQMNVGGINIPFIIQNHSKEMKDYRYEGYFYGGGYQYGLPLDTVQQIQCRGILRTGLCAC